MSIDFPEDTRERELRILLLRAQYERHVEQQTAELVEREMNRILDVMLSAAYRDLTANQQQRLNGLYRELDRLVREGYVKISDATVAEMRQYAQLEADVSRATANAVLSVGAGEVAVSFYRLPKAYLQSIAKLPIQGLRIGEWFDAQAATMSVQTKRIIQQGMIEGKGMAEISRRILAGDRVQGAVLSRRMKNEARAIVRTVVNAVQNDATNSSNRALPASVSDSYMWVSVRDSRTTPICRALDGRVWKYDDDAGKLPPAHIACRSTTRALIRGTESPLTDQRVPPTMRSYSEWLKTQTQTVQDEILGPTRADWWRTGRMSLADTIDADNRVLTLPQLREKLGLMDAARELVTT